MSARNNKNERMFKFQSAAAPNLYFKVSNSLPRKLTSEDWEALIKFSNKYEQTVKESHNKAEFLNRLALDQNKQNEIGIEEDNEEEKSDEKEELVNKKPKIEKLAEVMSEILMNNEKYGFIKDKPFGKQPIGEPSKMSKILNKLQNKKILKIPNYSEILMSCIQAKLPSQSKNSAPDADVKTINSTKRQEAKNFENRGAKISHNNAIAQLLIQRAQQWCDEDLKIKISSNKSNTQKPSKAKKMITALFEWYKVENSDWSETNSKEIKLKRNLQ